MNIETIQLTNINPAEYNPRIITKDEFAGLKASLETFGQQENLIVNKDMTLISGHQRLQAMLALGWTEAVCNVVDLDKHEEKKLNVIMNSQAIAGKFDELKLAEILEELKLDDNYESLRLNELEPLDLSPTEVEEDEPPEVSSEPPVSKLGEVYQLGRHRVMCGDSTDKASVELLMDGVKADMVFTDPPYNTQMQQGRTSKEWGIIENDNMTNADFGEFCNKFVDILYSYSKDNTDKYICMGWSAYNLLYEAMPNVKNCIVWVKNNFGLGHGYRPQHEFIVYDGGTLEANNQSNVWNESKDASTSYKHPTQKPTAIPARAINNSSKKGAIVLDLFLGSGSTLIACEQTDRTCYGMELDPKYVDVIRKRYWKFVNGNEEGWEDGTTNSND